MKSTKQKLALGHQEFSEVINNNCIYVDKTKIIYDLVTSGKYYFLSRPRRFGKSLLANTIKELFLGNKKLFKGLWIEDKWDWEKKYPVIKISFARMDYRNLGLETAIDKQLTIIAKSYNIRLKEQTNGTKLEELIIQLSKKEQVVIIIDEYDKPIIDYMDDIPKAEENRDILKSFYSVFKDADKYLKFFFLTGVSKFSQVSIFSDLNNLEDITIDGKYSQIVGWTKEEVEHYFPDYISEIAEKYKNVYPEIMPQIKKMYNGYSWDGENFVHNPVSLMNLFKKQEFGNYWFATGTPTFLMKIIKKRQLTSFDIENQYTSSDLLDKYDFTNINLNSLLFQTGYLTMKSKNFRTGRIKLDYPNQEVALAFSKNILNTQSNTNAEISQSLLYKIIDSLFDKKIDVFIKSINVLFKNIAYQLIEDKEKYFHSLFFLIVKLLGVEVEVEIQTIDGRIDAVLKTETTIYIVEFKINQSAKKAIEQIKEKEYALKYANDTREIQLLGINFETEKMKIEEYILEEYK